MILVLCLLAAVASSEVFLAAAVPTYTVVAPDVVRPNTDFRVAISAHDIDADQGKFVNDHRTPHRITESNKMMQILLAPLVL